MSEGKPQIPEARLREFVDALFAADNDFQAKLAVLYDQYEDCVPQGLKDVLKDLLPDLQPNEVVAAKASIMFNALGFYSQGGGNEQQGHVHSDSCAHGDDPN